MLHNMLRAAAIGSGVSGQFVSLDGTDDYIDTPDDASFDITGDLDIRVAVAMDDWTPASFGYLVARYFSEGTNAQKSWGLRVQTDGSLFFIAYRDASTALVETSSSFVSAANGDLVAVRCTLDIDNGASGKDTKFYTKATTAADATADLADNTGWTQLGATQTTSGAWSSLQNVSQGIAIGRLGSDSAGYVAGDFYGAYVIDGIDGIPVAVFDPNDAEVGDTTVTDSETSLVWAINGSTSVSQ